jgi:dTDP-glucose 4,6-dehydratase/UDP-glucose 4-epimerase
MIEFKNLNVLITGGLGFIGSNLAENLVKYGSYVTCVDSLIPEYGGNTYNVSEIKSKIDINIADIRDQFSMNHIVKNKDIIFNLAGQTSHLDSMEDPLTDLDINCRSQITILEACKNYNPNVKIVFASTRQIYGKPIYLPVDENHPIQPIDVNGINKFAGESYHLLYHNVYGINSTVLRLTNTFGQKMRIKDSKQTFLGIWLRNVLENKPICIYGDGSQLRDLNYIDDVVNALLMVAIYSKSNGKVYNLGSKEIISLNDLAEKLTQANGSGVIDKKQFPKKLKKIDIGNYYSNFDKITKEINWKPKFSINEGLLNTLNYYRSNLLKYI